MRNNAQKQFQRFDERRRDKEREKKKGKKERELERSSHEISSRVIRGADGAWCFFFSPASFALR